MSRTPNLRSATVIHTRHGIDLPHYRRSLDFTKWDKLEYLEFRNSSLVRYPPLPETLKHLDISGTRMVPRIPTLLSEEEKIAVESLWRLETFICEGSVHVDLEAIYKIIEPSRKAGNLKTLRIGDGLESDEFPHHFAEYSIPSLRTLSLTKWLAPEEQLLVFLRHCPAIENLDISSTKITGVAVKELMTRESGPLKWLRLNNCTKLSPDAVDYARSLGAVVEYSITRDWSSGKASWRVRRLASGL
jgi:F-box/TPR repeat protein Pof3